MNDAESKPSCILRYGDKAAHLFKVTKGTVKKIWNLTPSLLKQPVKSIDLETLNFFFGLVTGTGLLQIWDLRKRRAIFSIDLEMPLYWGEVIATQHDIPTFAVSSRLHGTLLIYNWSEVEEGPDVKGLAKSITPIELPDKAISFNRPVLWKSKFVSIVCGTDAILSIDISCQKPVFDAKETKLDSPISLLKGFKNQSNLLLVGTEVKDLHLINSQTSQIISTLRLAGEIDKNTGCIMACDGDENTGLFAVGLGIRVHVIKIDFGTSDSKAPKLSIERTMVLAEPLIGVSHLLLHPNRKHIAIATLDFGLTIYEFPEMRQIHKCVTNANQGILSLHFVTSTEVDVDGDEDPDVKRNFDTKQDLVYIAAATPDGSIRVWNLSGW